MRGTFARLILRPGERFATVARTISVRGVTEWVRVAARASGLGRADIVPLGTAYRSMPAAHRAATRWVGVEHPSRYAATYVPLDGGQAAVVLNTLVVTTETAPFVAAWAASLREDGRRLLAILDAEGLAGARQCRQAS